MAWPAVPPADSQPLPPPLPQATCCRQCSAARACSSCLPAWQRLWMQVRQGRVAFELQWKQRNATSLLCSWRRSSTQLSNPCPAPACACYVLQAPTCRETSGSERFVPPLSWLAAACARQLRPLAPLGLPVLQGLPQTAAMAVPLGAASRPGSSACICCSGRRRSGGSSSGRRRLRRRLGRLPARPPPPGGMWLRAHWHTERCMCFQACQQAGSVELSCVCEKGKHVAAAAR